MFFISANFFRVNLVFDGSFLLPLFGTGAKYGESVSTNNLSEGIYLTTSTKSLAFKCYNP